MKLVSFKVTDEIALKLESLQGDEKSISLVAKRIVEESLENASRKIPVEEKLEAVEEKLDSKIDEVLDLLRSQLPGKSPKVV
ncbi:hypothetical protein [Brasilonema bromeliae]|uniref:Ribbon-helix-helix protein CopG domain-containing protein n=1 Tax=Brasilonema bromeliae SPC951 TaxID=385972 RepID=A0ABX1P8F1_9CYAN|nr:hypothetical protein [Brasilonema bromeliae]NMG20699.1 hypothetical protein [Brasilonema bromeliae SPC951]